MPPNQFCSNITLSKCAHYYQTYYSGSGSYGSTSSCYVSNGLCVGSNNCLIVCGGTTYTSNCATAPPNYCAGYYSIDSAGSFFSCVLNPSTNKCIVPIIKYPCTPIGSVQCNGPYGYGSGWSCASFTTQATCSNAYVGPTNGQKNQCVWDTAGYCYMGPPCYY